MKYKWLLMVLLGLSSCSLIEENINNKPYTGAYESYQIGNSSSSEVTLHFYSNGAPKKVYAEIYNQASPVFVTPETAEKPRAELLNVANVTLLSGQTILFYELIQTYEHTYVGDTIPHTATSLLQKYYYYNFIPSKSLIGDSVVVSIKNQPDSVVPMMVVTDLWDTWYDEKNFIYFQYWHITD